MARVHTGLMRVAVGMAIRTLAFGTLVPIRIIAFLTAIVNRIRKFFMYLTEGIFVRGKSPAPSCVEGEKIL